MIMSALRFVALASLVAQAAGCKTDLDCSLAGQCNAGACICEGWTKGADCAELNLQDLRSTSQLQVRDLSPLCATMHSCLCSTSLNFASEVGIFVPMLNHLTDVFRPRVRYDVHIHGVVVRLL